MAKFWQEIMAKLGVKLNMKNKEMLGGTSYQNYNQCRGNLNNDKNARLLKFKENNELIGIFRLWEVLGDNFILGMDWVASMLPLISVCEKKIVPLRSTGKEVTLEIKGDKAMVRMCQGSIDLINELKRVPNEAWQGIDSPSKCEVVTIIELLKERHQIISDLKTQLRKGHDRMSEFANNKRTERQFKVGDEVYIKLLPYCQISVADTVVSRPFATGSINKRMQQQELEGPNEAIKNGQTILTQPKENLSKAQNQKMHAYMKRDQTIRPTLQILGPNGGYLIEPVKIHARRQMRSNNEPVAQLWVKWVNTACKDSSWEDYYSYLILEGKNQLMEEGMSCPINSDLGIVIRHELESCDEGNKNGQKSSNKKRAVRATSTRIEEKSDRAAQLIKSTGRGLANRKRRAEIKGRNPRIADVSRSPYTLNNPQI